MLLNLAVKNRTFEPGGLIYLAYSRQVVDGWSLSVFHHTGVGLSVYPRHVAGGQKPTNRLSMVTDQPLH